MLPSDKYTRIRLAAEEAERAASFLRAAHLGAFSVTDISEKAIVEYLNAAGRAMRQVRAYLEDGRFKGLDLDAKDD